MSLANLRLIDGEIGTQLLKYEKETEGDPLWCSRFNVTNPKAVYQCYMDFLEAGAELIRTNTYQSSVDGFKRHLNLSDSECRKLFKDIVELAQKARSDFVASSGTDRKIGVWASVGSYGAYLSDGSEYNGSFLKETSEETIRKFHKERLDILLSMENPLDGVAVETIPSVVEAEIVVKLFNEFYPKVNYWISFNCQDGQTTAYNEPFGQVVETIWMLANGKSRLIGIGVNCVDPKIITPLFKLVDNKGRLDKIPLIAYPNTGERFDLEQRRWVDMPDRKEMSYFVPQWFELGMTTVGGCCRNGSQEITNLRQYLDSHDARTGLNLLLSSPFPSDSLCNVVPYDQSAVASYD